MSITVTEDKSFLIKVLQSSLNWPESSLRSFSNESLKEIYKYYLKGYKIAKAKVRSNERYDASFRFPKLIIDQLHITKGEWFDIALNIHKKEIYFYRNRENRIKLHKDNKIYLPYKLVEKNLLRPNDDIAIITKGNKIILKSFTYFQD